MTTGREQETNVVPLDVAAAENRVSPAALRRAAQRGIINAWTEGGVFYIARAEAAVYAEQLRTQSPPLDADWQAASDATNAQYRGAYIRLR